MGLSNKIKRISREEVERRIDAAQAFSYYFGNFKFGKCYNSVFRRDKNSSTGFYLSKSGKIIYNDLSTGDKYDCFAFVAKKFNLSYGEAIQKIACDFGLIDCKSPAIDVSTLKKLEDYEEELGKETVIDVEYAPWSWRELDYWSKYHITEAELAANDVYNVGRLVINNQRIANYRGDLRFCYIEPYGDKIYKKIYQPEGDARFKWVSSTPLWLLGGHSRLSYAQDTLLVLKATKDRIIASKYHTDTVSLQNESVAALKDVTLDFLKSKYKRIIVLTDSDKAGVATAEAYCERGVEGVSFPEEYGKEIKDLADLTRYKGLKSVEFYLKNLLA